MVDPENKGRFGIEEFEQLLTNSKFPKDTREQLYTALSELDHEGVGKIKVTDAQAAFTVLGEPLEQDEFIELVKLGDPRNTGMIDIKFLTEALLKN